MPPVPNLLFSTRLATSDVEQSTKSYRSIVYREAEVEEEAQQRKPEKLVHALQQLQRLTNRAGLGGKKYKSTPLENLV